MGILDAPVRGGVHRGAFAATTAYRADDIVVNAGVLYSAIASFVSGASFNAADWTVLSTSVGAIPTNTGLLAGRPSSFTGVAPPKGSLVTTAGSILGATYRSEHTALIALAGVAATFVNWYKIGSGAINDTDGPNAITIESTLFRNGVAYPLLFSGSRSHTLQPGESVTSDLTTVSIDAADVVYVQTYVSVGTVGMKWPTSKYGVAANNEGSTIATGANLDLTAMSAGSYVNNYLYSPIALSGQPANENFVHRMVLLSGDSITQGYAQGSYGGNEPDDHGFAQRVCTTAGIPYVSISYFAEYCQNFIVPLNRQRRMPVADRVTSVICGYGFNDLKTRTAAQIEPDLVANWTIWNGRGVPCYQTTICPHTTSTDTWATLVNQTLVTAGWSQTQRDLLNAWIRDLCPIDAGGTPLTTGTAPGAGVYRAGAVGHPLAGVLDTASAVEDGGSESPTGKWKVAGSPPHYTSDGIHPSPMGYAAMAAVVNPALLV